MRRGTRHECHAKALRYQLDPLSSGAYLLKDGLDSQPPDVFSYLAIKGRMERARHPEQQLAMEVTDRDCHLSAKRMVPGDTDAESLLSNRMSQKISLHNRTDIAG